jgi:histone deacetylase 1/2
MPLKFWNEAFNTAVYLINRLPSSVIQSLTPMERLFGNKGYYSLLRLFGCIYWPNIRPYTIINFNFAPNSVSLLAIVTFIKGTSV